MQKITFGCWLTQLAVDLIKSKAIFQAELDDAWIPSAGDAAKVGRKRSHIRWAQIHMIEEVEELGTELQAMALLDPPLFDYGKIDLVQPGQMDRIARGISEPAKGRGNERRR